MRVRISRLLLSKHYKCLILALRLIGEAAQDGRFGAALSIVMLSRRRKGWP